MANGYSSKKILGINLKTDIDAILLGAGVMFVAFVIPVVSTPLIGVASKVRAMIGGTK